MFVCLFFVVVVVFLLLFFFFFFFFFCKLRQTNFRHWCFEKEELFFVS